MNLDSFFLHHKKIYISFLLFSLLTSTTAMGWWMWTPGDHVDNSTQSLFGGYHPDQPIPFSHELHAGKREIPCQYCHSAARKSTAAGIPPVNLCMGCHKFVKTDSEHIKFIKDKFDKNQPIEWTRVHDLPDYVRFSHQPHVMAKDGNGQDLLSCQTCHGQVEKMGTAEQFAPLQMGWCIECHNKVKIPAKDGKEAVRNAPVTCNTCHF